jgi:tripartite ATP-independent transporter DctP family solute receptor
MEEIMPRATQRASRRHRLRAGPRRRSIVGITTLALLSLSACAGPGGAQSGEPEHTLIAGHQLAAGTSFDEGLHDFADRVAEKTDGRVEVEVYSSAQLGSETDLFENMRNGLVDVAVVSPGFIAEFVPEMSILSMPFLVTSRDQRDAIIEGPVGAELEQLLTDETGNHVLTYFGGGARQMFFNEPVEEPEDLAGRLFRAQPSQVLADSFGALGMQASNVDYGELYSALQQDVVSGADNESMFIVAENFQEAAPYIYVTNHEITIRPAVISGETLDELPEELQDAVLEAGEEAGTFAREFEAEEDDAALDELREDEAVTVVDADTEELAEMVEPIWEQYAAQWEMDDLLADIQSLDEE